MSFFMPFVIGSVTINFTKFDNESGIEKIELYLDDEIIGEFNHELVSWFWYGTSFGSHQIKIIVWDKVDNSQSDEITVWKIF